MKMQILKDKVVLVERGDTRRKVLLECPTCGDRFAFESCVFKESIEVDCCHCKGRNEQAR